jgi:hypothetical protein
LGETEERRGERREVNEPDYGRSEKMNDTMRSVAHCEIVYVPLLIMACNSECFAHSRQCVKAL